MKISSSLVPASSFLRSRAFTIIELLVVIAIIALLTGIIMTSLVGSKAKARDAKRVSDLGNIQLALELYYDRCKEYSVGTGTDYRLNLSANNGGACSTQGITLGTFLSVVPTAPPGSPTTYYEYYTDLDGMFTYDKYVLRVALESNNVALQDDADLTISSWANQGIDYSDSCMDTGGAAPNQYCLISN